MIDRDNHVFSVKPLHGRKVYSLPLSEVAEMVVGSIIRAEIRTAKRELDKSRTSRRPLKRRLATRGLLTT